MAKIAFSKFGLKENKEVKTIKFNDIEIEVKQYLPVNDKLNMIARIINASHDTNYASPIKIDVNGSLEIVYSYTNISFTDKQKEDPAKLYDILDSSGLLNAIIEAIPEAEYNFVIDGIDRSVEAVYSYENSVLGILESIKEDYSALDLDSQKIADRLSNKENLTLLKDVVTKLG